MNGKRSKTIGNNLMIRANKSVAVIGQGYVGLPLSLAAHNANWSVLALDIDETKLSNLRSGKSPIEDVTDEQVVSALSNGLIFTSDFNLISQCEIVVVCVPTPLNEAHEPDLTFLRSAVQSIARFAKSNTLLINESTSFPTTTRILIPKIVSEESPNLNLLYAVAPERVDPGNIVWNYQETPRLVSGLTDEATERTLEFYSSFCHNVIKVRTLEVAEFSKVLENTFRQVNIALVNEMVPVAQELGVSLFEVIEAAATKPYGYMPFWPGVGVGGHCIPIDPLYLSWFAKSLGLNLKLVDNAQDINDSAPKEIFNIIESMNLNKESNILQIGLTYKAGVRDLRESPSITLFNLLQKVFHKVEWWDSSVVTWNGTKKSPLIASYDLVVVTHKIDNLDVEAVIKSSRKVLDLTGQFRGLDNVVSI